jgi:flavine halogenase
VPNEAAFFLFSLRLDESGWAWFIPSHDGTTSVGIVMNQKSYNKQAKQPLSSSPVQDRVSGSVSPLSSTASHYLLNISLAPGVQKLIGATGTLVNKPSADDNIVRSASDFSYSASMYARNGYCIVGDAGGQYCLSV